MRTALTILILPLVCHNIIADAASVFAGVASEDEAVELAGNVELKSLSSGDLSFLIKERKWLPAAQRVLNRAKETPLDFAAPVRSAVSSVRKELDDLIRALDKSYGEASQVSPAFQWAQNSTHIFFQVKFAQRWNAPGALEVENTSITVSDCCFSFKGFGEHSMIRKEYKLFLQFLDPVVEAGSSWHFAAAGRLVVTVLKARPRNWERLLRSENVKPENMGVWRDMQEKWKSELASVDAAKFTAKKKDGDDDDEDYEEDKQCAPGSFSDSKVQEFCPERLPLFEKFSYALLYYVPESSARHQSQSVSRVWRALADVLPSVKVGAVDCMQYKAFCEQKGLKTSELPVVRRYLRAKSSGKTDDVLAAGETFAGEFILEDLAAWASASEATEEKVKPGKSRKRRRSKEKKADL